MKKVLSFLVLVTGLFLPVQNAIAQYRFTARVVSYRNCDGMRNDYDYDGIGRAVFLRVMMALSESYGNIVYPSKEFCEVDRKSISGQFRHESGCTVVIQASECMGPSNNEGNSIEMGSYNMGSSFYSTNPSNEIHDWARNSEELRKLIGKEFPEYTMDPNGYILTGDMPGLIGKFVTFKNSGIAEVSHTGDRSGIVIPDDVMEGKKPFYEQQPWSTADLDPIEMKFTRMESVGEEFFIGSNDLSDEIQDDLFLALDIANIWSILKYKKGIFELLSKGAGGVFMIETLLTANVNLYTDLVRYCIKGMKGEAFVVDGKVVRTDDIWKEILVHSVMKTYDDVVGNQINKTVDKVALGATSRLMGGMPSSLNFSADNTKEMAESGVSIFEWILERTKKM